MRMLLRYHAAFRRFGILTMLGCCAVSLLPQPDVSPRYFSELNIQSAYENIASGTAMAQLGKFGVDPTSRNAQMLPYREVIGSYMPETPQEFEALPNSLKNCLEARNRCTALIYRVDANGKNSGKTMTFFFQDRRLAFKTISSDAALQLAHNARAVER